MKGFFSAILVLCGLSALFALQGEIVSCSGCKLNHLHEVRRFIKEPGHADSYKNVKVTYIGGHNPDLVIKDDNGNQLEVIDLSKMTTDGIHNLMVEKGFERKSQEANAEL